MKRGMFLIISLMMAGVLMAQDVTFHAKVSLDTVLMGNYVEVRFELENGNSQHFEPPTFEGFTVVGGPNHASSFSMINGEVTQRMSVSYFLEPKEAGVFYIGPAFVEVDGEAFETAPVELFVKENPDGIKQEEQRIEEPQLLPQQPLPKPREKKKKRKIYKI